MIGIVDTHCHLADERLYGDLDGTLQRAAGEGVETIVAIGAIGTIEADQLTVEIAERHRQVFAAVGVHPHNAADCDEARIAALTALASSPRVVAIGETGLDFHYMHSPADAQERAFRRHLELARTLELPVVIHCRDAERRLCEIIREAGLPRAGGVVHCFTGNSEAAAEFVDLKLYVSFSGILTFRNARSVREAARTVPEERLLIETDAPYLAPEPYRGRRNEPAYVRRTFDVLCELRGADPLKLASRIRDNASRLFRIPPASCAESGIA
jgi:TatD DNase family protein